jgi:hypothetical protein
MTISPEAKPLLTALREQKEMKMFYYRGMREWGYTDGYLTDTCLSAQDNNKAVLDYFRIKY